MPRDVPVFRSPDAQSRTEQKRSFDRSRRRDAPWRLWYGRKEWKARRAGQLATEPLCERCREGGYVVEATVVHHALPHRGDWHLFITGDLESLCKRCHDRDAQADERSGMKAAYRPEWLRPSAIPLTIVCGAPGAGKSHYVSRHARAGDVVIDLDAIASQLSGETMHGWDAELWLNAALLKRNELLGRLSRMIGMDAWFIVCEPKPDRRQWWADKLAPREIVVLEASQPLCLSQASRDPDRDMGRVTMAIGQWWSDYRPRAGDRVIRAGGG
jgi:5-methylcytosine-specific restriction endonuclease McrA